MAYNPTIQLTAYILSKFPAPEYSDSDRADLLLFAYDDPNPSAYQLGIDYPAPCEIAAVLSQFIAVSLFGDLPEEKYVKVFALAEFAATLAWQNGGGFIGVSQLLINDLEQISTSAPTGTVVYDNISTGALNYSYLGPGIFRLSVPGLGSDVTKVFIFIRNGINSAGILTAVLSGADAITISAFTWAKDAMTDAIVATVANDFLTDGSLLIYKATS